MDASPCVEPFRLNSNFRSNVTGPGSTVSRFDREDIFEFDIRGNARASGLLSPVFSVVRRPSRATYMQFRITSRRYIMRSSYRDVAYHCSRETEEFHYRLATELSLSLSLSSRLRFSCGRRSESSVPSPSPSTTLSFPFISARAACLPACLSVLLSRRDRSTGNLRQMFLSVKRAAAPCPGFSAWCDKLRSVFYAIASPKIMQQAR